MVHRLDRETSGVLLVAKTSSMLRHLQNLLILPQQDIKRHYLLVVHGQWPERKRRSLAKLLRTGSRTVVNESQGQPAETHFRVVRKLGQHATLLQAQLITGRKHQIRVHCQHEGHPIAGDSRYGLPEFNRWARRWGTTAMMLHAHRVEVPMPDGQVLAIEAPTPHYFRRIAQ